MVNKNGVTIEIEDNGLGIKKKYLPKLTGMFYRAHPEKKWLGIGPVYRKRDSQQTQWGIGTGFRTWQIHKSQGQFQKMI